MHHAVMMQWHAKLRDNNEPTHTFYINQFALISILIFSCMLEIIRTLTNSRENSVELPYSMSWMSRESETFKEVAQGLIDMRLFGPCSQETNDCI